MPPPRQEQLCNESRWDFPDPSGDRPDILDKASLTCGRGPARDVVALRATPVGGAWRSLVARLLWEQEVPSSNLGAPTMHSIAPSPIRVTA